MPEYEAPGQCPVCRSALRVSRLRCSRCGTAIEGDFRPSRFDRLTREQRDFAELFVVSRGNLRELERMLGLSYPTVRSRLEAVIQALGYPAERRGAEAAEGGELTRTESSGGAASADSSPARGEVATRQLHREVLDALEGGHISVAEALARLAAGSAPASTPRPAGEASAPTGRGAQAGSTFSASGAGEGVEPTATVKALPEVEPGEPSGEQA